MKQLVRKLHEMMHGAENSSMMAGVTTSATVGGQLLPIFPSLDRGWLVLVCVQSKQTNTE